MLVVQVIFHSTYTLLLRHAQVLMFLMNYYGDISIYTHCTYSNITLGGSE